MDNTLKELETKLEICRDEVNSNPTMDNLMRFEHMADTYSDKYRGIMGFRPSCFINNVLKTLNEDVKKLQKEFNDMPNKWEFYKATKNI